MAASDAANQTQGANEGGGSVKHIIGFSGGIDSQATALWVRRNFPAEDVILCNADPGGNEHPITTEFIEWYSVNVFPVVRISPIVADMAGRSLAKIAKLGLKPSDPMTFETLALIKGVWPASQSQFCTTHLKLEPQRRWCYQNGGKGLNEPRRRRDGSTWRPYGEADHVDGILSDGYERYSGVRRSESERRKDTPERMYDDYFMCWLNHPLAAWTKADCFRFVAEAGEKWNPLYDMGFSRVGCAPCVNSNKEDIRMWAARSPEMIDKVRGWEATTGRTFFRMDVPDGAGGMRLGWVDDLVKWSRTVRGGKQMALPMLEADVDSGMCMNQYGFCE
jgi:3'-phosphoadenosine 5'-phosphosulfate sulfotransferase (PAPS reductase)/FAD synthetase